jgi:NAD-specific glutamate dehydrogenase
LATLSLCAMTPEAVLLSQRNNQPIAKVLKLVLAVGEALRLPAVTQALRGIPLPDRWTRQAVQTMVREMFFWQVRLAGTLLHKGQQPLTWLEVCGESCGRYHALVDALLAEEKPSVAMASVLLARLRELEQD